MTINKTIKATTTKINFLLLRGEKDLFLKEEEPHLKQTILPPNDLSETRSELPQFKQILLELITDFKIISSITIILMNKNVKKNIRSYFDIENLLQ